MVSHGQAALAANVLRDLDRHAAGVAEVILTLNVPEALPFDPAGFRFPVRLIENAHRKGFGANHNSAFGRSASPWFCVLNPDIRLHADPFPPLLERLQRDSRLALAAPLVVDLAGRVEDSARAFPTPVEILRKAVGLAPSPAPVEDPDWVAGMFMLCRAGAFKAVGGFDERYFLYYEDVDLCARLRLAGYGIAQVCESRAIHDARRQSRRELRYFLWHLRSMLRFFASPAARRLRSATRRDAGTAR